jgi:hypothetical protein
MKKTFEQNAGLSLIIFTILLVVTMVIHPAGGSIEKLIRISNLIIITHAIAILSLPFGLVGFWGLTKKIGMEHFASVLGFAMMALGLVAVMMAAAANGLIMPIYLQDYKDASPETIETIRPVLRYSFAINHAFDYIYTAAFCIAMLCWSITILTTKKLAAWLGWLGIILALAAAIIFISGVAVNSLFGFRLFVASIIAWIALVGLKLWTSK